jgi:sensor c-di-GMP phosphodiesterase-like protein
MNKTLGELMQRVLHGTDASELDSILQPITQKTQELRDFANRAYATAKAHSEQAQRLLEDANELERQANRALRIAANLEDEVK